MVAHFSPPGDDQIELRLRAMAVIRTVAFAFWNADEREIERMTFGEVERVLLAPERDRDVFDEFVEFSFGRFPFVFGEIVEIDFAHEGSSVRAQREASKNFTTDCTDDTDGGRGRDIFD